MDIMFQGIKGSILIQVVFRIGGRVDRVDRRKITNCEKNPIGVRVINFYPNVLIEGVNLMKLNVRRNIIFYVTSYTTKTFMI